MCPTNLPRVVVHEPDATPELMALCAGFERGAWRGAAFVDRVFEWLPSFALPWSEQQKHLGSDNAIKLLRTAARVVYSTDKYSKRGEFGELILHGVLGQEYDTTSVVAKIWLKDATNDPVKGFDVVHIAADGHSGVFSLWLGEGKLYTDLKKATAAAAASVADQIRPEYLRSEFMLVSNKIDTNAPYADALRDLLDSSTSLDDVFDLLHVPVLIAYQSEAVGGAMSHDHSYVRALTDEAKDAWRDFRGRLPAMDVALHLILIPLPDKGEFVSKLDERLRSWQNI